MENWKPSQGTQYKKKNRYEMKDGDVVFRILPQPKGNNVERSGRWSKYLSVHWGYKNSQGKLRTFESSLVKNAKTKMIEVTDPALERLNDLKAKLEKAKEDNNQPLVAKLSSLVGFKGLYNVDNNHYMNVIGLDGNIGLLKLRYTAKQALDVEIEKLRTAGVEPLSFDNGRYFVFSRSGTNRDTAFKVTVYAEQVDALTSRQVVHKVTPEILARLETEGFDLDDIAPKLTSEEIGQIVKESDLLTGKSPAVDRLIDARWKAKSATKSVSEDSQDPNEAYAPDEPPAATTTPPAAAPTAQTAHATAQPGMNTAQTWTPAGATKTTPQTQVLDDLSDEDFFKQIGVPV